MIKRATYYQNSFKIDSRKEKYCMENILKIERIEKYYGNKTSLTKAIDNISFEVKKGEFVCYNGNKWKW